MINVVDVYCRDMFVYCATTQLNRFSIKKKSQISEREKNVFGQLIMIL
jgi:hypothetical protein